ncbi:MAG: carbon-nitrogen hydrolase family protein [Planctomycetota bacterium]|jgi:predicted amidohydrolase|nr:carbon-nitrogen hydrolase family protein [Planctomycetota bacterium]
MSKTYKVAGVQMNVELAKVDSNRNKILSHFKTATANGADLTVFPECATTGYCFDSLEESLGVAESCDGETCQLFAEACRRTGRHMVYGYLENQRDTLYNSLNLVGPTGLVGTYRKIHLPFLGVDRFTTSGETFRVYDLGWARVGLHICYDGSFPESGRCLALQGADLLVLPTNWPPGSLAAADVVPNARAMENHTYFMSVNRVGRERGFDFIGKSKICDPDGRNLVFEDHTEETVFYAEIDPLVAREKKLVRVPGKHEIDRFEDRHPDKYATITAQNITAQKP